MCQLKYQLTTIPTPLTTIPHHRSLARFPNLANVRVIMDLTIIDTYAARDIHLYQFKLIYTIIAFSSGGLNLRNPARLCCPVSQAQPI